MNINTFFRDPDEESVITRNLQAQTTRLESFFRWLYPPFGPLDDPFFERARARALPTSNGFGMMRSIMDMHESFFQHMVRSIESLSPLRRPEPVRTSTFLSPIRSSEPISFNREEDLFLDFDDSQMPMSPLPFRFLRDDAHEETKQDEGLTSEQISGLKTTIFEEKAKNKQEQSVPRLKGRNGIFKEPKPEPHVAIHQKLKNKAKNSCSGSTVQQPNSVKNPIELEEEDNDDVIEISDTSLSASKSGDDTIDVTKSTAKKDNVEDSGPTSDATCAICIENYKSGDELRSLPCEHKFHKECVDNWLVVKNNCPVCKRKPIEADNRIANPQSRNSNGNRRNVIENMFESDDLFRPFPPLRRYDDTNLTGLLRNEPFDFFGRLSYPPRNPPRMAQNNSPGLNLESDRNVGGANSSRYRSPRDRNYF